MTRRGVLAALATVGGAMGQKTLQLASGIDAPRRVFDMGMDGTITVYDGDRSASVAAKEMVDALLPVKPNHCPACGFDCGPAPKPPEPWEDYDRAADAALAADKAQAHGDLSRCPKCSAAFWRPK